MLGPGRGQLGRTEARVPRLRRGHLRSREHLQAGDADSRGDAGQTQGDPHHT